MMLAQFLKSGFKYTMEFKGFGFSLIDNQPRELIYMSVYRFNFV